MSALITTELVALDVNLGTSPEEVIRALASKMALTGRASNEAGLVKDVLAREAQASTGQFAGIAIPHCRSESVVTASLSFARLTQGADFGASDNIPSDLIFMIAAPAGGGDQHLVLLTALARALVRPEFTQSLRDAKTSEDVVALVSAAVSLPDAPEKTLDPTVSSPVAHDGTATASAAKRDEEPAARQPLVLAITACPTGIAHTYMAAESLENMGKEMGIDLRVETQGSTATKSFDPQVIGAADAVIFATDVGVKGRERFAGKPVIESGVKRAIREPRVMIEEALAASIDPQSARVANAGPSVSDGSNSDATAASGAGSTLSVGLKLRQALLTGVSYMIPFVAAGGLLMAIGFLVGGYDVTKATDSILKAYTLGNLPVGSPVSVGGETLYRFAFEGTNYDLTHTGLALYLGTVLFKIGNLAIAFLVPALSGYIAFALADRPGIAPGFLGGAIAVFTGAGFIGGIVTGLLAGLAAYWISTWSVPKWMRGLMPVMIIPLLSSLFVGGVMLLVLGSPLKAITDGLTSALNGMSGTSAILLGIVLGLMMAFDLGGPVNKAAYSFATAGLGAATIASPSPWYIMAAVMGAGMVPPLAMGMATFMRRGLFTKIERENGISAIPLGLCFISEGAIPFAASDPFRVIPSMMLGAATTGGIIMGSHITLKAPHGGLAVIFAISPWYIFLLALLVGTLVSACAVIAAKSFFKPKVALAA